MVRKNITFQNESVSHQAQSNCFALSTEQMVPFK